MSNKMFLIGGMDLEMHEIVKILKKMHIKYVDKHLTWGASWKDYEDITSNIPSDTEVYGIELSGHIPSQNCKLIDHHNENAGLPASILQVCDLLDIKPSRYVQLVAANDAGYIPAMEKMGATPDEIKEIRKADRKLSGCSEKDEKNAESAFEHVQKNNMDFIVAYCETNKFSPFLDTHYNKKYTYLLWGDGEAQVSGKMAEGLLPVFKSIVPNCWSGGGQNGFIGGYMSKEDFDKLKASILSNG